MSSPADRDIEQIVETHKLAQARRRSGRPVWDETVDVSSVWRLEEFKDIRDGVVKILKASKWYKKADTDSELHDAVEELSETSDTEEFDWVWRSIYDLADADRIWIKTS